MLWIRSSKTDQQGVGAAAAAALEDGAHTMELYKTIKLAADTI